MKIIDAKTTDNKVYTLTTTYYNDNTYNVQVTIDGKVIEKHFTVRSDCAELKDAKTKRISDTTAKFQYLSDSSGTRCGIRDSNETGHNALFQLYIYNCTQKRRDEFEEIKSNLYIVKCNASLLKHCMGKQLQGHTRTLGRECYHNLEW